MKTKMAAALAAAIFVQSSALAALAHNYKALRVPGAVVASHDFMALGETTTEKRPREESPRGGALSSGEGPLHKFV